MSPRESRLTIKNLHSKSFGHSPRFPHSQLRVPPAAAPSAGNQALPHLSQTASPSSSRTLTTELLCNIRQATPSSNLLTKVTNPQSLKGCTQSASYDRKSATQDIPFRDITQGSSIRHPHPNEEDPNAHSRILLTTQRLWRVTKYPYCYKVWTGHPFCAATKGARTKTPQLKHQSRSPSHYHPYLSTIHATQVAQRQPAIAQRVVPHTPPSSTATVRQDSKGALAH